MSIVMTIARPAWNTATAVNEKTREVLSLLSRGFVVYHRSRSSGSYPVPCFQDSFSVGFRGPIPDHRSINIPAPRQ